MPGPRKPAPKSPTARALSRLRRDLEGGPSRGRPKGGRFPALGPLMATSKKKTKIGTAWSRPPRRKGPAVRRA